MAKGGAAGYDSNIDKTVCDITGEGILLAFLITTDQTGFIKITIDGQVVIEDFLTTSYAKTVFLPVTSKFSESLKVETKTQSANKVASVWVTFLLK